MAFGSWTIFNCTKSLQPCQLNKPNWKTTLRDVVKTICLQPLFLNVLGKYDLLLFNFKRCLETQGSKHNIVSGWSGFYLPCLFRAHWNLCCGGLFGFKLLCVSPMVGEFSNPPSCAPNPKHSPLVKGGLHPLWHCEEDHIHSPNNILLEYPHQYSLFNLPSPSESGEDSTTAPIGKKWIGRFESWVCWRLLDFNFHITCLADSRKSFVHLFSVMFEFLIFVATWGVWTMRLRIPFYRYIWIQRYVYMTYYM